MTAISQTSLPAEGLEAAGCRPIALFLRTGHSRIPVNSANYLSRLTPDRSRAFFLARLVFEVRDVAFVGRFRDFERGHHCPMYLSMWIAIRPDVRIRFL
jgi:hypothetical protein